MGEKGVRLCRCRSEDRRNQTLAATRIPRRYENCTFESYKPRPATDEAGISQRRAINDSKYIVDQYPAIDVGLLFLGPCGVGKTHLATAIVKELALRASQASSMISAICSKKFRTATTRFRS